MSVASRKLRYGMIGGGPGAFIGGVHRKAAALDGGMELVAGAFSSDPEASNAQGRELRLDPERTYGRWEEMVEHEAERPAGERLDFVTIVTPNHLHHPTAKACLEAGFHVVCDKPMTNTVEEAEDLVRTARAHDAVFALTHNYTGYPMVKQARVMVSEGDIGTVRKVIVEYPLGWLARKLETEGHRQAEWRTDPNRVGVSSVVGDQGSHAENLVHYITGLEIESLCADVTTFLKGRRTDDDANLLLHYKGGARGLMHVSQICVGERNTLTIRIYGEDGTLEWRQISPNVLVHHEIGGSSSVLHRADPGLAEIVNHNTRLPVGHPEGFIEAFANIYVNAGRVMLAREAGEAPHPYDTDYPTAEDGARGVSFIHRTMESARLRRWVEVGYSPP